MAKKPTADGQVKARVLTACQYGKANDVVVLDEQEAAGAMSGGLVDTTPEAVAYAESIATSTAE